MHAFACAKVLAMCHTCGVPPSMFCEQCWENPVVEVWAATTWSATTRSEPKKGLPRKVPALQLKELVRLCVVWPSCVRSCPK
eukprot:4180423-Alexandrium_andersonii.AAC.1